ncbi:MAG: hypothetical protein SGJ20_12055 [Planctomycetota bacterium]|nr:hypothetical protein [Planctomycetota bacterium]
MRHFVQNVGRRAGRQHVVTCLAVLIGALVVSSVYADIADPGRPRPRPRRKDITDSSKPQLVVTRDAKATESVLTIPAKFLKDAAKSTEAEKQSDAGQRQRTIVAGIAMSLAVGGLFFVRRGSKRTRIASVAVVGVAAALAATNLLMADIPPPIHGSDKPAVNIPRLPEGAYMMDGPLKIVIADAGDDVKLVLAWDLAPEGRRFNRPPRDSAAPASAPPPEASSAPSP